MAAVIGIGRLRRLLDQAERSGATLAWLGGGGGIEAGFLPGTALFRIDLVHETLTPLSRGHSPAEIGTALASAGDAVGSNGRKQDGGFALGDLDGSTGGRRTGNYSLILEGTRYHVTSQKALLVKALRLLERLRPGTLEKLSDEKGRTKRPVARDPKLLYERGRTGKYAQMIEGGWWIATNNSFAETEKYIRRAAFHAGLHVDIERQP